MNRRPDTTPFLPFPMHNFHPPTSRRILGCLMTGLTCLQMMTPVAAQDAASAPPGTISGLNKALEEARGAESEVRQRLSVRRVIRDAEGMLTARAEDPARFELLEFLFRARQQLVALDKDPEHRKALLETARELVKAPDTQAELRLEADLLLSQSEVARQGATAEARAQALLPFVERYVHTQAGAKALRMSMVIALELGDGRVITALQETIAEHFPADLEMIAFQRDKLGGQVIGAPFCGSFERSDGKRVRFPMDGLGRLTLLFFWSREEDGMTMLKEVAAAALEHKSLLDDRVEIVSFNLDELPDAGESIVRGLGVDWQVLRLPGGRKNPIYDAFVRNDPRLLSVSPTGQSALIMSGTSRQKTATDGTPDYGRSFGSSLSRSWNDPRYVTQLRSLMAGDFLVVDPEGEFDPRRPPELKALAAGNGAEALPGDDTSVPGETLRAIQDCFASPPLRYRMPFAQVRENYARAVELCRKAIADHPQAPDLWIVRNRLMIALTGLWKADADAERLEDAVAEARTALAAGIPKGCDLIARFCLARGALRDPAVLPRDHLDRLIADCGGDNAPGPLLAIAALLALDVADRASFERYRDLIFKAHTEHPMMWTFTAFLLDRHHEYWLFQVPFTAGWSYGRREGYQMAKGDPEPANRLFKAVLNNADGTPFRIPEDLDSEWTLIVFSLPAPWQSKRDDGLPPSPGRVLQTLNAFAAARPHGDVKVMLATFGGDVEAMRAALSTAKIPFATPILAVPDGIHNPLVARLGILSEDSELNTLLIRKDGRIGLMASGLSNRVGLTNVILREDEMRVIRAVEQGGADAAKQMIFAFAPPFDPDAVDERGRKPKPPSHSTYHLRARARVYMAMKEWDKALADAEEVVRSHLGTDGGMSLRTPELDEAEALRDSIRKQMAPPAEK